MLAGNESVFEVEGPEGALLRRSGQGRVAEEEVLEPRGDLHALIHELAERLEDGLGGK